MAFKTLFVAHNTAPGSRKDTLGSKILPMCLVRTIGIQKSVGCCSDNSEKCDKCCGNKSKLIFHYQQNHQHGPSEHTFLQLFQLKVAHFQSFWVQPQMARQKQYAYSLEDFCI